MMSMYRDDYGKTIIDIKDCETMREVKILKMGNLGLTEFDTQLLGQLDNLEEMDISRNQVQSIPKVVRLPCLRRLDCSHNRLSDLGFVGQFPRLEELNVEGNNLTFADFCIASFLCPKLKSVNGQVINIVELNRIIESRVKPKIKKIWSDHMGHVYHYSMSDAEFSILSDNFLQLVTTILKPSSKTISKFQDFRIAGIVDDFLERVRNEEVIEFGGSEETVKRNYAKKKSVDVAIDPTLTTASLDGNIAATEEERPKDCVVVAMADEHGNGVISAEFAAEHLKNGTCVDVLVEHVADETMDAFRDVPSAVAKVDTNEDICGETTSGKTRDEYVCAKQTPKLQKESADKIDEKQKVIRYWVYDEERTKSKDASGQQDTANTTTTSSNGGRQPRKPAVASKAMRELLATMKSKGTLPDAPKIKMPDIDVQQAAQLIFDIKSSPMVVYRGRHKKETRSYTKARRLPAIKRPVSVAVAMSASKLTTERGAVDDEVATIAASTDKAQPVPKGIASQVSEVADESTATARDSPATSAPSLPHISENHYPPKKRVRFIDAIADFENLEVNWRTLQLRPNVNSSCKALDSTGQKESQPCSALDGTKGEVT